MSFMADDVIKASTFKATCLKLLDEVAEGHRSLTITKHGRPVARLVPITPTESTMGSVTLLAEEDEDYFTAGEDWDVES